MPKFLLDVGKKLFLTSFQIPIPSSEWQERDENMTRQLWVFDDVGCIFEAVPPINPFAGGEISDHNGPSSVYHLL